MKKILSLVLAAVMVVSMFAGLQISSSALEPTGQCGENVYYTFNSSTGTLTISGEGDMYNYSDEDSPFYYDNDIMNVIIENGVTSIGSFVFYGCSGLTSVTIGNSVKSIGDYAFYSCSGLTSVTIPDSVTSIGDYAFRGCSGLSSATIGNSVKSIGESAFEYCKGLTSFIIPSSVTSIYDWVFYECRSLTSISIPNSVTSIGEGAFEFCTGLTSIIIPDSVTSIGDNAFFQCSALNKITIPNSTTSIGNNAFYYCSALTSAIIGNSVKSIGNQAFDGCSSLTSINIPNSVTSIGDGAFALCESLTSITISNSVTRIGDDMFDACSNLISVVIPGSVTSIGNYAFELCRSLTSVTIPKSVISIGDYAFSYCDSLENVFYSGTNSQWKDIYIKSGNDDLRNANIVFDYTEHKHSFNEGVVTQPTCTQQGYTTHTCECGDVKVDTYVPALGHDLTFHSAKAETCTAAGNQAYYECSRCHNYYTDSVGNNIIADKTSVVIPAKQHKFESNEQYCLNGCGTANPDYIPPVPAHIHAYTKTVVAPKANAVGYTLNKCACGNSFKSNYTAPTGKPAGLKCVARTAAAEKFTWTKTSGVSGYQVQLLNSAGKSAGTANTTGTTYTFSKLAAGHAYKARVRFFIKAADGKNYYGAWTTINSPTLPAGTSLVKVTGAKKAFTAQWKKGAVTGYQLQYATNNKFSGAKTVTIKKAATLKYTVKNLAAKKAYYVRVRTYKTMNKVNYYSAWSAVKSVKTK